MAWQHGSILWNDIVVQVEEVKSGRRGLKPTSLGWRAKLELDGVDVVTTKLSPTARDAEQLLVLQLRRLT